MLSSIMNTYNGICNKSCGLENTGLGIFSVYIYIYIYIYIYNVCIINSERFKI